MTPEQFRDARSALRALRRVKRWCDFDIPVATGDFESVIRRGKRALPEYRAMMEAKRRVRDVLRRTRLQLKSNSKYALSALEDRSITVEEYSASMQDQAFIMFELRVEHEDSCAAYREARKKFIERIGGEG